MKKVFVRLLALLLIEAFAFATIVDWSPAQAQFTDQRSYASSTGGSANAQTAAIANYALNAGVELRIVPSFTNNAATTFNVNATGAVTVLKQTTTGLAALTGGEIVAGQIAKLIYDGSRYQLINPQNPSARQPTPTTSFYVNTSTVSTSPCGALGAQTCQPGSDVGTCGLSIATPCATIQNLLSTAAKNYDFGNSTIHFYLAHGTYNECLLFPSYVYSGGTDKQIIVSGDHNSPGSTIVNCTTVGNNTLTFVIPSQGWTTEYFQIQSSNSCSQADYGGVWYIRDMFFGACNNGVIADGRAFVEFIKDPVSGAGSTIVGTEQTFLSATGNAQIVFQGTVPITVTNGLNFAAGFVTTTFGGLVDVSSAGTISGAGITGTKYTVGQSFDNSSNAALGGVFCGSGVDCNSVLLGNVSGNPPQARYNQFQVAAVTLNTSGATAQLTGSGTTTQFNGPVAATGNVSASGGNFLGVGATLSGTISAAGATLTGAFVGTSGAFSGAISAVGETFTGALTGTSAVFSSTLAATAITGTNITASGYLASGSATPTGPYGSTAIVSPTGGGGAAHRGVNTVSARCAATSGTSSLANGFNCATLTTSGAGVYSVSFANNLANADYQISLEPSAAICTNTGTKTASGFGFISYACSTGTPGNFTGIMDITVTGGN